MANNPAPLTPMGKALLQQYDLWQFYENQRPSVQNNVVAYIRNGLGWFPTLSKKERAEKLHTRCAKFTGKRIRCVHRKVQDPKKDKQEEVESLKGTVLYVYPCESSDRSAIQQGIKMLCEPDEQPFFVTIKWDQRKSGNASRNITYIELIDEEIKEAGH